MSESPVSSSTADQPWRQIERHLDLIAQLVEQERDRVRFYEALLRHTVDVLTAAEGGAVWARNREGTWDGLAQVKCDGDRLHAEYQEEILDCAETGDAVAGETRDGESVLFLCPVTPQDESTVLIAVVGAATLDDAACRAHLKLLEAVAELAGDYERRHRLRHLEAETSNRPFEQFTQAVHGHLDLQPTLYSVANDGRQLIGCDRVSVLVLRGRKLAEVCTSGVDSVNRHSRQLNLLKDLCHVVAQQGEPFWYGPETQQQVAPEIERRVQTYVDESHVRRMGVLPLGAVPEPRPGQRPGPGLGPGPAWRADRKQPCAILVTEEFAPQTTYDDFQRSTQRVAELSRSAVDNSLRFHDLPLRAWLELGAQWFPVRRLIVFGCLALLLVAALALVPATMSVSATGVLQPQTRRHVFAPEDAVVDEVLVEHGRMIDQHTPLLLLRRDELEQELARIEGELLTTRQMLEGVRAERFAVGNGPSRRQANSESAAKEEGFKQRLTSLEEQARLLRERRSKLEVNSPIAGKVLTWTPAEELKSRPVTTGQILLTVADVDGPWNLELEVADRDIRHVLEARRQARDLSVKFSLATNPGVTFEGTLGEVAQRSEVVAGSRPGLRVKVKIDASQVTPLHPGAGVVAKIDCGQRAIGYVWLHEFWETIQLYVLF